MHKYMRNRNLASKTVTFTFECNFPTINNLTIHYKLLENMVAKLTLRM